MIIWTVCFVVGGVGGGLENGWCGLQCIKYLLNILIHQNVLGLRDHSLPGSVANQTPETAGRTFDFPGKNVLDSLWFPITTVFSALSDISTETPSTWWDIKTTFSQELVQETGKWIIGNFGLYGVYIWKCCSPNKLANNGRDFVLGWVLLMSQNFNMLGFWFRHFTGFYFVFSLCQIKKNFFPSPL